MSYLKRLILVLGIALLFISVIIAQDSDVILQPTPTPTFLSSPTNIDELQSILISDKGCKLPCFLGFHPGITESNEVLSFAPLEEQSSNEDERLRYTTTFYLFEDQTVQSSLFVLNFIVDKGLLYETQVTFSEVNEWLPSETFDMPTVLLGQEETPEIYLSINLTLFQASVILHFKEAGILAQYIIQLEVKDNVFSSKSINPFLLCPSLETHRFIKFWLRSVDTEGTSEASLLEDYIAGFDTSKVRNTHYWDIQEMTGFDPQEFAEEIIENPHECIELPSYRQLIDWDYPG